MKFDPPKCPVCGADPASITEMVLCIQPLFAPGEDELGHVDPDNDEIEYNNDPGCKVHWDSQTPWEADGEGGVNLTARTAMTGSRPAKTRTK